MRFEYTDDMRADFKACIDKNIRVYPIAVDSDHYHVEVDNNGKKMLSRDKTTKKPIVYEEKEAWEQIFKYYAHYSGRY